MSLRLKTLIIIGATLACLFTILFAASKLIILRSFARLEDKNSRDNIQRALNAWSDGLAMLDTKLVDWSAWDDTYAFIEDENEDYTRSNLVPSTFTNQGVNLLLFINSSGRIVFEKGYDLNTGEEMPAAPDLSEYLGADSPLFKLEVSDESSVTGVVLLPEGPMLLASRLILTSDYAGPARGVLIMGRYLDNKEIKRLADITDLDISFVPVNAGDISPSIRTALSSISETSPVFVKPLNEDLIAGYALINDIHGKPSLVLSVEMPRDIYKEGQASALYFILSLLAFGLVFGVLTLLLLEKLVLSRLSRFSNEITKIGASGDISARVPVTGEDELANVAGEVNRMLATLGKAQDDLRKGEELYRTIFETTGAATIIIEEDTTISLINTEFEKQSGYSKEEVENKMKWTRLVCEDDLAQMIEYHYKRRVDPISSPTSYEFRYFGKNGDIRNCIVTNALIPGTRKSVASLLDITDRKQAEERLRYLSQHDQLTGLYNRTYFEQEMRRLEGIGPVPVGFIVCDVDDLKPVNDTMGHDKGDEMLVAAAGVIKEGAGEGDVVARIGGDEFAILLPNSNRAGMERACGRIKKAVLKYNAENPELPLSLSIGFAVNNERSLDVLLKEADNNMYRDKLNHSQGINGIVSPVLKGIKSRSCIKDSRSERVQDLVANLAFSTGLPEHNISRLKLLAQFHDIGEMGVPDSILFKPAPFNAEEAAVMQKHCEIGHRIAKTANDLIPIADWILKHHEWWNGQGYPLGLKKEEIPLECRILSIVDAYTAMTGESPYRKAMTPAEAAAELKRYAGSQFDPGLVQKFVEFIEQEDNKTYYKVSS